MEIVFILIGLLVGCALGFLFGKSKSGALVAKLELADQMHRKSVEDLKKNYETMLDSLRKDFAAQKTELERYHTETLKAQQERFNETVAKVSEQMKSATNEMLKERQKEFAESSNQNLGQIVNPLKETIDKMKQVMNDSTNKQTAISSELKANIENMMRHSEAAKQSADELARVFKHGSKVQGDWGETVLDELLQSQGLTRGIHYDTQEVIRDAKGNVVKNEDGASMRPDVILHLDQRRELIIDSKVSLTAFMDYVNAEDEAERQKFLKLHIDSVQKHVKELSAKNYSSYIQAPKIKMDYVIMFVPHTGAMWTALNAQPDLWRKALEQNVYIADEQTLFAALRIVNLTWTQIAQAQNHEKVFGLANEMIDRVGLFYKNYQELGKSLLKAQAVYEEGEKKLAPQGRSIVNSARKLINLGAKQSDHNPLPPMENVDDVLSLEN